MLAFHIIVTIVGAFAYAAPTVAPNSISSPTPFHIEQSSAHQDQQQILTLFAFSADSELYDVPINADGGGFWVNRPTLQYCPPSAVASHCMNGTRTLFVFRDGTLGLTSIVPGGQEIYLAKDGAPCYTKAHSEAAPAGVIRSPSGFQYLNATQMNLGQWNELGRLSHGKLSNAGFSLCGPRDPRAPAYQLFINNGKLKTDCFDIIVATRADKGKDVVWQYD